MGLQKIVFVNLVLIRRPLVDLLQTAGPWTRRFPSAKALDNDHAAFQMSRQSIEPALQVVTIADDEAIIEDEDVRIIEAALRSGDASGLQSQKARGWGVLSVRNLIVGAMGVAALNLSGGAFKEIGVEVAKNSMLAQKSIQLIISSEAALLKFLANMPADIRAAVRALLDELKMQGSDFSFPIPRRPKEEPNRRRVRKK
jgi:hypothetical protein